jgi:hypothetical protein
VFQISNEFRRQNCRQLHWYLTTTTTTTKTTTTTTATMKISTMFTVALAAVLVGQAASRHTPEQESCRAACVRDLVDCFGAQDRCFSRTCMRDCHPEYRTCLEECFPDSQLSVTFGYRRMLEELETSPSQHRRLGCPAWQRVWYYNSNGALRSRCNSRRRLRYDPQLD